MKIVIRGSGTVIQKPGHALAATPATVALSLKTAAAQLLTAVQLMII